MGAGLIACSAVAGTTASAASSAPVVIEAVYSNPPASAAAGAATPTPEILSGALAAAKAINAKGGINGRQLKVVGCNFQNDPNLAAGCGRQAVSDGAVAVVGECFYGSNLDPILEAAKIPYFVLAQLPGDFTASDTFPIGPGAEGVLISDVALLVKEGHPKVGIAFADISILSQQAQVFLKYADSGLKTPSGQKSSAAGSVPIALTASDYTPFVESLNSQGANGVVLIEQGPALKAFSTSAQQLGLHMAFAETSVGYNNIQLKQLPNGFLLTDLTPPPQTATNLPGVKLFRSEMAQASKAGVANAGPAYYDGAALFAWLSTYAAQQAISQVKGTVTPTDVMSTLKTIKTMNLQGLVTIHPSMQGHGPTGLTNLIDGDIYYEKLQNGVPVLVQNTPIDFTKVMKEATTGNFKS